METEIPGEIADPRLGQEEKSSLGYLDVPQSKEVLNVYSRKSLLTSNL